MRERTIKSKRIFSGRLLGLRDDTVRLETGKISRREICEHPGAVAVVAVTGKKEIVLIRQFRKPAERVLLEIPAGLFNKGESLAAAAKRELAEETGYTARKIKKVFSAYMSPGYSTEVLHYFFASGLELSAQHYEEDEDIRVEVMPIARAMRMVKKGQVRDNKTIVGILITQWMS
ncbi:MAG TPA: NUDIX hydrolase [Candidatus Omnitrophota bacterium]|nr:NUDIX hydrolase [Candidatus Omnitrophota bacterium]